VVICDVEDSSVHQGTAPLVYHDGDFYALPA